MSDTPVSTSGMERQLAIYMGGARGEKPPHPVTYDALRERAREILPAEAFAYVAGGAGLEDTMRENRDAFRRWRIVPRHLRGVATRDLTVELLGRNLPAPILLAPVGVQGILHPEGELAPARAAAALGLPVVLSTLSSRPLEAVAEAVGDRTRWFQLYWPRDPELAASFLARAEFAGYGAVVVTLDLPLLAWRPRDIENAFLPFFVGEGLANYFSDQVFLRGLPASPADDPRPAIEKFGQVFAHPELTWDELGKLREMTRLPVLLKGILDPDDARRALDAGVDRLEPRRPAGRRRDRRARRAASDHRGGRGPPAGSTRQRRAMRGRRVQGSRARSAGSSRRPAVRVRPRRGRRRGSARPAAEPDRRARSHDGAVGLPLDRRDRPRYAPTTGRYGCLVEWISIDLKLSPPGPGPQFS